LEKCERSGRLPSSEFMAIFNVSDDKSEKMRRIKTFERAKMIELRGRETESTYLVLTFQTFRRAVHRRAHYLELKETQDFVDYQWFSVVSQRSCFHLNSPILYKDAKEKNE